MASSCNHTNEELTTERNSDSSCSHSDNKLAFQATVMVPPMHVSWKCLHPIYLKGIAVSPITRPVALPPPTCSCTAQQHRQQNTYVCQLCPDKACKCTRQWASHSWCSRGIVAHPSHPRHAPVVLAEWQQATAAAVEMGGLHTPAACSTALTAAAATACIMEQHSCNVASWPGVAVMLLSARLRTCAKMSGRSCTLTHCCCCCCFMEQSSCNVASWPEAASTLLM
jgi:hypothetical protein